METRRFVIIHVTSKLRADLVRDALADEYFPLNTTLKGMFTVEHTNLWQWTVILEVETTGYCAHFQVQVAMNNFAQGFLACLVRHVKTKDSTPSHPLN